MGGLATISSTLAFLFSIVSKPAVVFLSVRGSAYYDILSRWYIIHTPMWAGSEDAVAIVTNGVDDVLDSINGSRCKDNVLRPHGVDGIEV